MKKYLLFVFLMIFVGNLVAQTTPQNKMVSVPPSPEASSLFKFIETPVSQYTGIPAINIPVYTIALKDVSLPISLKYHSTGYNVAEQSSVIGLGWALEAGGQVSSTIMGQSDLFSGRGYAVTSGDNFPEDRQLDPQKTYNTSWTENADYSLLMSLAGNPLTDNSFALSLNPSDTQPDIFYYSMFDVGGKFFFGRDGSTHAIPFNTLRIEKINGGFQITDNKGTVYLFDVAEQTNTSSSSFTTDAAFGGGGSSVTNFAYHLSHIYTRKGDTINITYNTHVYSYNDRPSYTRYRTVSGQSGCVFSEVSTRVESTATVYGKFIAEITSNRGHKVEFIYDNSERLDLPGTFALKRIDVYEQGVARSFDLMHKYFNSSLYYSAADASQVKLKLKNFKEPDKPSYIFAYASEYGVFPDRFSDATDHWGYYNGVGGSMFPDDPAMGFTGVSKEPNSVYGGMGMLNKIFYPTGGSTTYTYEPNLYLDTVSSVTTATDGAGLYFDSGNPSQSQSFTIPSTVNSAGIVFYYNCTSGSYNPQFEVSITGQNSYYKSLTGTSPSTGEFVSLAPGNYSMQVTAQNGIYDEGYVIVSWTYTTIGSPQEQNVYGGGLRIATIRDSTGVGGALAYTKRYTYNKSTNQALSSGRIFNKPIYSYVYEKKNYSASLSNSSVLVESPCFYYTQTSQSNLPLSGMQYKNVVYTEVQEFNEDASAIPNGYTNNTYSFAYDLKPYRGFPFTPATSYEWMSGHLLKSETYENLSSTYILKKRVTNTYQENYTPPTPPYNAEAGHFTPASAPNEAHAMGLNITVIRPEYLLNEANSYVTYPAIFSVESYKLISSWRYLSATTEELFNVPSTPIIRASTYYFENPMHAQVTKMRTNSSDGREIFATTTYPQDYSAGTTFIDDMVIHNLTTHPIEEVRYTVPSPGAVSMLSGSVTEYAVGGKGLLSNFYSLEIARPLSFSTDNFKFSAASAGNYINYSSPGTYIKDSRYELRLNVSNYDSQGNLLSMSAPNGPKTVYIWSYQGQYPVAEIKNAELSAVVAALGGQTAVDSFRDSSTPDVATFLGGLRAAFPQALITTYTYKPLVGMTSMTDPKGMTTTYEYDSFQRLLHIKDQNGNIVQSFDYHYKQ